MRTIEEVISNHVPGLYYGNRVLLPFSVDILKMVFGDEIITDFNGTKHDAKYKKCDAFTEVYLLDFKNLYEQANKYSKVKVTVVESGKDVFDFKNHVTLCISVKEKHQLNIEILDEDILYIE